MSSSAIIEKLKSLTRGIPLDPLPPKQEQRDDSVPHAPVRRPNLTTDEEKQMLKNALRYFPTKLHNELAPEFLEEYRKYGHIYMYRFRPTEYEMKAYPIEYYPCKTRQAAAIMVMIMNNLDRRIAQFPHELITYGGNGSVLSNWAQYHLLMKYLSEMTEEQTLSMYSGHPLGLLPSHKDAPRVVITNGMVIPNYSSREEYDKMYAMGNTIFGQMTAGSYCYIGPQGIVHGTTLTILNAGRKYLGLEDLKGKVYVSSGLGGMSGAQPKAGVISGCVSVTAEVDKNALLKRYEQGWVMEWYDDLNKLVQRIKEARNDKKPVSLAYHGNIVSLWERLAKEDEFLVELGSDQTSCHNPFNGGYYPVQISFDEAKEMMVKDPAKFKNLVQESLRRQVTAINKLTKRGMRFWDYGNSFLLEASRANADIMDSDNKSFRYPSYVEDIMGDIFSLGFGPFRWVCTSGDPEDLATTDKIAAEVIEELQVKALTKAKQQYKDNYLWITQAKENKLVVGSQARILYSDAKGRIAIALAFNDAVQSGRLKGPVALSRDHHDVSGTDSPWRETSNIRDGSMFCADMAIQTVIGNAFRGATWVSIHNGGGTGWGEAINGGFGMVLDGSPDASRRAKSMLHWDVNNGVARRAWAGNDNAIDTISAENQENEKSNITMPHWADDNVIDKFFQ